MLILLGAGVVANVILPKNKGFDGGWLLINFGWGLAVFAGVYVAYKSGAHLNPAVTIGHPGPAGPRSSRPGIPVDVRRTCSSTRSPRWSAPFVGAVLAFLAYKQHFDEDADPAHQARGLLHRPGDPLLRLELRHRGHRHVRAGLRDPRVRRRPRADLGPLAVALLVVGIGASLGGPTGYAINPARDLGPRIAHAAPADPGQGLSDWALLLGAGRRPARRRRARRPRGVRLHRLTRPHAVGPVRAAHRTAREHRPAPPEPPEGSSPWLTPVRPRDRPGHHQLPRDRLRPRRPRSSRPARSSTSRSSRGPAGSSTTPSEIWNNVREVVGLALTRANLTYTRHRRRRHHQPARDHGRLGPDHRRAGLQRDRLAGHPHADDRRRAGGARRRRGPVQGEGRPAAGDLLLRPEGQVDPRQRRGRAGEGRAGDLLFGNIDSWVLWNMTGGADGGVHVTDVTNASRTMLMDLDTLSWDEDIAERHGHPAVDAARDPVLLRGVRPRSRGRHAPGRADRRHPRRPAGGHVRPGVLRGRQGQEHLRHRQLHAA